MKNISRYWLALGLLVVYCGASTASASLRMPRIFTDHMVLQQQMPIALWGWAEPNEKIEATLGPVTGSATTAADGTWHLSLPPVTAELTAEHPTTMLIKGTTDSVTFNDVLIGEVWLAGGQSNMNRPVSNDAIKSAEHPNIRLFTSNGFIPRRDELNSTAGWKPCSPESIITIGDEIGPGKFRPFSEVAYHFAVKLNQELKVPVGIIHTSCGGSTAKDWTPNPDIEKQFPFDVDHGNVCHKFGVLYQSRLRGAIPFTIRGVIWYQGEDDAQNPAYAADLSALIQSWRGLWHRDDLPFYFAQIAQTTYMGGMLGVTEAQTKVMSDVMYTGMAPSNDLWDGANVAKAKAHTDKETGWPIIGGGDPHPSNRAFIAVRLARIALSKTYAKEQGEVFGPMVTSYLSHGDRIDVKFAHAGKGLKTDDGQSPNWFQIAGEDRKFVNAEATIVGTDTVQINAAEVKSPKYFRFAWNALARHNLYNSERLAAINYRSDQLDAKPKPVKVFILAGQSNMQGKGSLEHLEQLVKSEPAKFGHLMKDEKWIERDDVFVSFPQLGDDRSKDMQGKLSVGYSWPPKVRFGPELGFGEVVGDAIDKPVLLIKACWGGQSLDVDFRPPSAGWDRELDLNNRDQWKPGTKGWAYKQVFNNIHMTLDDLGAKIPELKGREYEIVGFVWFQGWNDLIDAKRVDAYQDNLVHFIRDIRKHLNKPNLPFVIAVMGQDGDKPAANMKKMRAAQSAPADMDEFKGNVIAVQTFPFWDPTVKYDGGYHYMGSARFYYDAGHAMGDAMLQLLKNQETSK